MAARAPRAHGHVGSAGWGEAPGRPSRRTRICRSRLAVGARWVSVPVCVRAWPRINFPTSAAQQTLQRARSEASRQARPRASFGKAWVWLKRRLGAHRKQAQNMSNVPCSNPDTGTTPSQWKYLGGRFVRWVTFLVRFKGVGVRPHTGHAPGFLLAPTLPRPTETASRRTRLDVRRAPRAKT